MERLTGVLSRNAIRWGLAALILFAVGTAWAQTSTQPKADDLGVRLAYKNDKSLYLRGEGTIYVYLPEVFENGYVATDSKATAIKIASKLEGDGLRLEVSALFGAVKRDGTADWKNDFHEEKSSTILLRSGESTTKTDLSRFGIPLVEVSVVDAKPKTLRLGDDVDVVNRTKSLEIVGIEESLNRFKLSFLNNSKKTITAYTLGNDKLTNDGFMSSDYAGKTRKAKIAAGDVHVEEYDAIDAGWRDAKPSGKLRKPKIIIAAVVFDDVTTEGIETFSKDVLDIRRGRKDQFLKIIDLMKAVDPSTDEEVAAALNDLKLRIDALAETSASASTESAQALAANTSNPAYEAALKATKLIAKHDLDDLGKIPESQYGSGELRGRFIGLQAVYQRLVDAL